MRAVVGGSAVVPLLALAWIAAAGSLPDMLEQVVTYNRAYLATNQQYRASGLVWASGDALFVLPLIVAALARLLAFRQIGANRLEVAAVVWLVAGIVLVVLQGLFFDHYLTALAPPLIILATPALGVPSQRRAVAEPRPSRPSDSSWCSRSRRPSASP